MTNRFMVSVAALALIAGTGIANAQGMNKESGGASGGSTMQHSTPGADTSTGSSKSGTTTGQSGQSEQQKSPGAMKNERAQDNVKGGSTNERAEDRAKGTTDTNRRAEERNKGTTGQAGGSTREDMKSENREGRSGTKDEGRSGTKEMNRSNERSQTEMNRSNERTTGQAGAGAKLTSDQRTKITSVIRGQHTQSVDHVDFALTAGTRVPRDRVHVQTLPSEVVSIYPQWRGYDYIVVHDKIVIIDPNTYEIVEIIES